MIKVNEEKAVTAGSLGTPRPALAQFDVGKRNYGLVVGPRGYIVTENDFCHQVRGLRENVELRGYMPWEEKGVDTFEVLTLEQIQARAEPVTSYRQWAHYWGIKSRIENNYKLLLDTMNEIGADTSGMPEWGEDPVTQESI